MQPDDQFGNRDPGVPQPPQALPPRPPVQPTSQVVSPQVATPPPVAPVQPAPQPIQPQVTPAPAVPLAPQGAQVADPIQGDGFTYEPEVTEEPYGDQDDEYDEGEIDLSEPIRWQATEYIHQEKNTTWFIGFAIVLAAFMAVAILLMQSWSFAILLVVIAVVVVVLAKRPPRIMEYSLSEDGLHVGETLHKFGDFKSFGLIHDGQEFSIMLIPRRRLQPGITVYFPEEAGEDIVDVLGSRLPMRDLHLDAVDRLVRKLRL